MTSIPRDGQSVDEKFCVARIGFTMKIDVPLDRDLSTMGSSINASTVILEYSTDVASLIG